VQKPGALQPGQYYHIYNRGNNRDSVFFEDRNYRYFLQLYIKYIPPIAETFAYCLLRNHLHLLIRCKWPEERASTSRASASPSQQFSNLFNAYAKAINKGYNRTGSLFQSRFGRIAVEDNDYLIRLTVYIHQNPERHGLIADFRQWPYSSYQAMLSSHETRLEREAVLSWFGGEAGFRAAHLTPCADSLGFLDP